MTRKEIIEKICKIRELAQKGVAGEMLAANEKLLALMDKYGITEDELEEKEESNLHIIDTKGHDQLFVQVFHTFFGCDRPVHDITKMKTADRKWLSAHGFGDKNATVAIDCTKSEWIQIVFLFQSYLTDYQKQSEAFEYAYYSVNNLLPTPTDSQSGKEVDDDIVNKAMLMSRGIDRHVAHKAIENTAIENK